MIKEINPVNAMDNISLVLDDLQSYLKSGGHEFQVRIDGLYYSLIFDLKTSTWLFECEDYAKRSLFRLRFKKDNNA